MRNMFECWINEHEDGFAIFPNEESARYSGEMANQGVFTCQHVEDIGKYQRTIHMIEVKERE